LIIADEIDAGIGFGGAGMGVHATGPFPVSCRMSTTLVPSSTAVVAVSSLADGRREISNSVPQLARHS
jgi:hypothetical protein